MTKTFLTSTIIELYSSMEAFIKKDIELPAQVSWDLETNSETFRAIVEKFERSRAKILNPLQEKNAFEITDANRIRVKEPYIDEFQAAMEKITEYLNTENEIEIKTIQKADIPDSISVKDLRALKFMISV